ncbi:porin family protein [uncultured Capnocytophaga sp.]|uniref:porin family protein n=1 Tax=uncultured Capnocytophaga sp. TaxID=159273 RepID=UPI00262FE13B|nr:porin family protein [uncultured Capnocytophaga sp.]
MRKIALLIALTFFGLTQANAQNFGFKGGYNYSSFNGEVAKDNTLKGLSGFYVGALLELPLGDVLSLQPEVIYSRQGAAWEQKDILGEFKKDLKLDYLNIPVMAKVNLGPLFLQGGVQFGFLVGKPEVSYTRGAQRSSHELDKDAYAAFDFGVGAGLGVNLNQHFFIEARYTHSLTNALDPDNNSLKNARISDDNNFKNAVLSVGLGVKF